MSLLVGLMSCLCFGCLPADTLTTTRFSIDLSVDPKSLHQVNFILCQRHALRFPLWGPEASTVSPCVFFMCPYAVLVFHGDSPHPPPLSVGFPAVGTEGI